VCLFFVRTRRQRAIVGIRSYRVLTRNTPGPEEFAARFAASMREFATGFFEQVASAGPPENVNWRAEACAALWAATQAVFDSSVLSPYERRELIREITRNLVPFWQQQCASGGDMSQVLAHRSAYGPAFAPGNLVGAADSIVLELMRSTGMSQTQPSTAGRTLASSLAERMLADLRRIDDYKKQRERRRPARYSMARA
jgi:hypothetical protein